MSLISDRCSTPASAMPPTSSAMPMTNVAATIVLDRTVREYQRCGALAAIGVEPVADHADRLDRAVPERCVDLASQLQDVHLDDVSVAVEGEVPHVTQ